MKVAIIYSPMFSSLVMGLPMEDEKEERVFTFETNRKVVNDVEFLNFLFTYFNYQGQDLVGEDKRYFDVECMPSLSAGMLVRLGEGGSHRLYACERSGWSLVLRQPVKA